MTFMQRNTETPNHWRFDGAQLPEPTRTNKHYEAHATDYVDQFNELVRRWRLETAFLSSVIEKTENECFKKIVRMGPKVVNLVIRELTEKRDFLFMALHFILPSENPVPEQAKGKPLQMIEAWLSWAERRQAHVD